MTRPHQPASSSSRATGEIQPSASEDQTWLEFLRSAGGTVQTPHQHTQRQNSASSTTSAERKRRLTSAGMADERRGPRLNDGRSTFGAGDMSSGNGARQRRPDDSVPTSQTTRQGSFTGGQERRSSYTRLARTNSHEVPRWQPDQDVVDCPVCQKPFTLLNRRHHCRKCGRVVCKPCSPHKITIPRPFIVRPPGFSEEETGGGEEVRVCKPCVPDPWVPPLATQPVHQPRQQQQSRSSFDRPILPPQPFQQSHIGSRDLGSHRTLNMGGNSSRPSRNPPPPPPPPPPPTSQGVPPSVAARYRSNTHHSQPTHGHSLPPGSAFASSVPARTSSMQYQNMPPGSSMLGRQLHQHRLSQGNVAPSFVPPHQVVPGTRPRLGTPRPGRRQIKEEDECPICHLELPPGEQVREAHIIACIESNTASTTSTPPPAPAPPRSAPPTSSAPIEGFSAAAAAQNRPRASSHRPAGMLVFKATEKDCSDGEGHAQECVICMEEFEEGDEMGRMECWCKFHRACIRGWWERKGYGSCPTHQLQQ